MSDQEENCGHLILAAYGRMAASAIRLKQERDDLQQQLAAREERIRTLEAENQRLQWTRDDAFAILKDDGRVLENLQERIQALEAENDRLRQWARHGETCAAGWDDQAGCTCGLAETVDHV